MKKWMAISAMALVLVSCEREKTACPAPSDKNFAVTGFSKVAAGETFTVTLSRGSGYSVYAKGCANDLADLDLSVGTGETLNIGYTHFKRNRHRVDLSITLPKLVAVNLSGEARGTVNGFKDQPNVIRSVLSGNASCTLNGAPLVSQVELSGNTDLTITGATENLYGNINGNAILYAYGVNAIEVDISASGNGMAYVAPLEKIFGEVSGNGRIYYRGTPRQTNFTSSGNGKIFNE
jgi:Putative auto-transporter adhesin, head GIN domain